jgi:glycosyltransferase involved in cell wall biosynthesis
MKPEVSIVLPTKEEEGVFSVIKELRELFGSKAEIIVVDKSSSAYRSKVKKTGVKVIPQRDIGVENGILEGLRYASADILATIDADGTHELAGIKRGVQLVKQGKADYVLGNRMGNIDSGAMSAYLRFGNSCLSMIYNVFYKQNIHDVLTGMQVMSRKAYEEVKNIRPFKIQIVFFQTEVARLGYKVHEVPIRYTERKLGVSKLAKSKLMYGFKTADHIIRRSRYYRSFMSFGLAGVVLAVIGLFGNVLLGVSTGWLIVLVIGVLLALFSLNFKI